MRFHKRSTTMRRRQEGFTLLEVLIAAALLLMTSVSLAFAYGTTGLSSRSADRAVGVQNSLETVQEILHDQPCSQLLSWNGTTLLRSGHTVTVSTNLIEVGLILVELVATDDTTGAVLARLVTYRAGET